MKKNLGAADKIIRILLAVVIIALYLTNVVSGILATVLLVVAGVLILTSFISFCPLYAIFRIHTNRKTE